MDRQGPFFRVELNQPGLPEWLREGLQTEWASPVALLLLVAGAVPVWFSRRQIVTAPGEVRHLLRTARRVTRAATAPVAARIGAVVLSAWCGYRTTPPRFPGLRWE